MTVKRKARLFAGCFVLAFGMIAAPTVVLANDDDELGAYVYAATCEDLDQDAIIDDIGDLELQDDADDIDEYWTVLGSEQDSPSELWAEDEDIDDMTLDELVEGSHAIAVHEDDDRDSNVIACGNIEGDIDDGFLLMELDEVDGSGLEGRAYLVPDDDDDDDVDTVVGVWATGEVEPLASPTPAQ